MSEIVLFHSAQGLRPGVTQWADSLRKVGHEVWTPDVFEGRTFDRLEDGIAHRDGLGLPELIRRAGEALEELPAELVYAGFSMGGSTAHYFAVTRPAARGALLMHGVAPADTLGGKPWPAGAPAQVHYAVDDPFMNSGDVPDLERAAGELVEAYTYPGDGHLFADPDAPEYDRPSAELMLERELAFLERLSR
jgi:dienelactone hydrolase